MAKRRKPTTTPVLPSRSLIALLTSISLLVNGNYLYKMQKNTQYVVFLLENAKVEKLFHLNSSGFQLRQTSFVPALSCTGVGN